MVCFFKLLFTFFISIESVIYLTKNKMPVKQTVIPALLISIQAGIVYILYNYLSESIKPIYSYFFLILLVMIVGAILSLLLGDGFYDLVPVMVFNEYSLGLVLIKGLDLTSAKNNLFLGLICLAGLTVVTLIIKSFINMQFNDSISKKLGKMPVILIMLGIVGISLGYIK